MKKLLVLLFSLFFLSSPSVFADDISDFEIEGISIGDSLLDYMTEDEILKEIEKNKDRYSYLNEPNKYAEVYLIKDFQTYEAIAFFIKNLMAEGCSSFFKVFKILFNYIAFISTRYIKILKTIFCIKLHDVK